MMMPSSSDSTFSTGFRERPQKRSTYRLNANNIDFEFLRKNITSYLGGGALVHPTVRIMNGQEYYLYEAATPLIPSQVRDLEVDSAEYMERSSAPSRSHHRRVGSSGSSSSRGRRWRRRRDSPNPIIQLDVNIFMNGHSVPTSTISRSISSTPIDHHHSCANAATACQQNHHHHHHSHDQQEPEPQPQPQQQQSSPHLPALQRYEHPEQQRLQLAAMFTPAITPPPVEFYQPKPTVSLRAPSVSLLSAVSACSSPKTVVSTSDAGGSSVSL